MKLNFNFSQHGGALKDFQEVYGSAPILDFSSGLSPLGPPDVLGALTARGDSVFSLMPDPKARAARSEIVRHFPIFPENVVIEQSVQDLFLLALRSLRPKRVLLVEPCLADYRRILNFEGIEVRSFWLQESEGFESAGHKLINAVQNIDMVILSNPACPAGSACPRDLMKEVIAEARRRDIFVLIDEYYADWCMDYSAARDVQDSSFFFVMRSFASFYAVPGLRLAYGLGARKFIERMQIRQSAACCDSFSETAAVQILRDAEYREGTLDWFAEESAWMSQELAAVKGLKVFPSVTINLLVKVMGNLDTRSLLEYLALQGILLRGCGDYAGLDQSFLRITLREREDNQVLIQHLKEWMKKSLSKLTAAL